MNKRVIAAVAAGVLALLGVLLLVAWAQQANDRAFDGAELVSVVRLTEDVPAGTKAADLSAVTETVELPKESVPSGAVTELGQVSGLSTDADVQAGEVLLKSRMAGADDKDKDVVGSVPKGFQEVTIALDAERSVGGTIKVGDRVGVIVTAEFKDVDAQATSFVLDRVLITKVEKTVGVGDEGALTGLMVTLAVKPLDAERVVHGHKWGSVWLTRQNEETDTSGSKRIDGSDVLR
ncbi:MAG: cpaB [Aeromicrobium sp.]|nr:cpaB [Aeromicrobium sp.]